MNTQQSIEQLTEDFCQETGVALTMQINGKYANANLIWNALYKRLADFVDARVAAAERAATPGAE